MLRSLTSLRFFAAASIVLFHMGCVRIAPWAARPALASAVSFFFVLSGFVLAHSDASRCVSPGRFYIARFARIWPVHALTLVGSILLAPQLYASAGDHPGRLAFNLLLLQSWHLDDADVFAFNSVSWSLSTEAFFYLLFPLLSRVKRMALLSVVLWAAAFLILLQLQRAGAPLSGADPAQTSWSNLALHFPPMRLFEFTTGIAAARLHARHPLHLQAGSATLVELGAVLAAIGTPAALQCFADDGLLGFWASQTGSCPVFAAAIIVFAIGRGAISAALSRPSLVALGQVSFCTYMLHQPIINAMARSGAVRAWGHLASATFVIVVVWFGSYLVWRGIEVPARDWIVALIESRRTRLRSDGLLARHPEAARG